MRWIVFCVSVLFGVTVAGEVATIHLVDGSRIRGEVRSLKGGVYTIQGDALGTISIPQGKVRVVEYGATQTPKTEPVIDDATLNSVQSRLLSDPNILTAIQSLQNDPDVLAVMNDPEIQRAIEAGDYASLMNNAKIIRLMQNNAVKGITQQVR